MALTLRPKGTHPFINHDLCPSRNGPPPLDICLLAVFLEEKTDADFQLANPGPFIGLCFSRAITDISDSKHYFRKH